MDSNLSLKKLESKRIRDQVAEYLKNGGEVVQFDTTYFVDTPGYKALKLKFKSKNNYSTLSLVSS